MKINDKRISVWHRTHLFINNIGSFFYRSPCKAAKSTNHQTVFGQAHNLVIQFIRIGFRTLRTALYMYCSIVIKPEIPPMLLRVCAWSRVISRADTI